MTQALEKNQQKSMNNELYKQSSYYKGLIKRSLRYLSSGYPIHFTGESGIGKTTLALHIANQRKRPVMLINGNKDLSNKDLIGAFTGYKSNKVKDNFVRTVHKTEENVTESWVDGRLLEAVKNGYTLIYDEFTRSQPETNNIFLPILEERILPLYGTKRKNSYVNVHPDFTVIFTSNPDEYAGVFRSQDALLDRMITLPLDQMDEESEIKAVTSKTNVTKAEAVAIVEFVSRARNLCSVKQNGSGPSLRASIMIAEMAKRYKIPIEGSNDEFWDLCFDIVWFPLQACSDRADDRLATKLYTEFKKIK
ncbi:gas vesicle protein GvpN [Virgibacillus necropolis]|uniref:Gas vesicle protein GvpN n=1 Tax=Virgibacillus necropolis TaxID=163877 RepID=A0A221M8V6_9BACI|nr:gas vesicle protein GvpN [Virgibacillus necropolis]ASN04096.1 gas vesicle protein GvpN [Virgibacillus necropolis]